MCGKIFDLSDPEKVILKGLARNGPINKNKLFAFVEKSKNRVSYEKFQNLLYGSTLSVGLVKTGYIFEVVENKKRSGHNEKTLFLTAKGIIASIENQPLQKNKFSFIHFLHII